MTFPRRIAAVLGLGVVAVFGAVAQPVTQPFTFSLVPTNLPQVRHGVAAWGDYDRDGDLDVLISGMNEGGIVTSLYRNDGKVRLDPSAGVDSTVVLTDTGMNLERLTYSRAAWGDFDGDGDIDLVMHGSRTVDPPYDALTVLYRNDDGTLVRVADADFIDVHSGVLKWADVDNDGDIDLLVTGEAADYVRRSQIYLNSGGGTFVEGPPSIPGVAYGDASFSDFDRDGDLDLAFSGVGNDGFTAGLFLNEGGMFAAHGAEIDPVGFASVKWGDYDSDGDSDLLIAGGRITPFTFRGETHLYRNENGGLLKTQGAFTGVLAGSGSWGDYDNDGDLDVMILGMEEAFGRRIARMYENEGGDSFRNTAYLVGEFFASADWGDLEGDGDLDLLTTGQSSIWPYHTNLYENERQVVPPSPPTPQSTSVDVAGADVVLRWEAFERAAAESYNLRIGTRPGASDIVPAHAEAESGRRLLADRGNAGSGPEALLTGLQPGTYYWSVQALDAAYQGSAFSAEGSFTIEATPTAAESDELPVEFRAYPNYPNPFSGSTYFRVDLPLAVPVRVEVFDVLGRQVATLTDEVRQAGTHALRWDGTDAAGSPLVSGMYLYQIRAGENFSAGRMVIVR